MQKIIYIKDYKGYKKGEAGMVSNNDAHFLIEGGIASLASAYSTGAIFGGSDKMMRPEPVVESRGEKRVRRRKTAQAQAKRGYKTK